MLDRLKALHVAGQAKATRWCVRRYLKSTSAQVDALANAFVKKHGSLSKLPSQDLISIVLCAPEISAWHADTGRPVARGKLKRDGESYRWIRAGNVFQYARELLAKAAAEAVSEALETQFMSKAKGGRQGFENWLRVKLPSAKLVTTLDVPRCFALMKRTSVADALPLPAKVIDQVMFVPMRRTKYLWAGPKGSTPMDMTAIAQASSSHRGISEGSALSSVASELVLAMALREVASLGDGVHVASHGDNLVVLLDDIDLEEPVTQTLIAAICKHFDVMPGELAGRIRCTNANATFSFCRRTYRWRPGKLKTQLPSNYIDDFALRTMIAMSDLRSLKDAPSRDRAMKKIRRSILGWAGQSKASPAILMEAANLLAMLPTESPTCVLQH